MPNSQYDVVIIGAGCAGLSAAIGLAKAGFGVVALEAAAYPGAENWSGCVYFCENLVHPSLLGPEGMEDLAWERRLVQRGIFASNGYSLLGMTYRDPDAFRHCYTVLRPVFDHHLAQLAIKAGVVLLNNTTAESLIRDENRVIGVATNRGPVYANLTFLAEGDASHLVAREGYERAADPKRQPKFLHGIKQIIDLPPGAVERNFGLSAGEGAAYEIVLRNGTLRGELVQLNMGGFVYTNRQSLSIGLVLPADHLHEHFGGDPNLLMEWFENIPDLQMWLKGGTRGVFGAKLIRGGGVKDIPRMVDDGLAIGGAATAIGVDFPFPNYTGPATRMGLQIVEAAKLVRQTHGSFTHAELEQHYLEPLRQTRYWCDVEYLRRWPGYVEKTRIFFGRNVDLTLGTAYLWTRPKHWLPRKLINWVKMVLQLSGPGRWRENVEEVRHLNRALQISEIAGRPAVGMLLLHGWMNTFRDFVHKPRLAVSQAGQVQMVYSVAGSQEDVRLPPMVPRWFRRFAPVLAAAARHVYQNDDTPLPQKLRAAVRLLMQQINLLDAILASLVAAAAALIALTLLAFDWLLGQLGRKTRPRPPRGVYGKFADAVQRACDLTPLVPRAAQQWEDRLGQLAYFTAKQSHIHLHWPQRIERKMDVVKAGLWHVCPAHVYEAKVNAFGQLQLVVNFENCIKCETCWRTSDFVDWGRDGGHRFVYPVHSPALPRLLAAMDEAGRASADPQSEIRNTESKANPKSEICNPRPGLHRLIDQLGHKLDELGSALDEEPRHIDMARAEYLALLARYAQQLADGIAVGLHGEQESDRQLAAAAAAKVSELNRHLAHRKYAWAAATGRQIRQHHLPQLRRFWSQSMTSPNAPPGAWLQTEHDEQSRRQQSADMIRRLDEVFGPYAWRELEKDGALTQAQDATLLEFLRQVPAVSEMPHPPLRKALLAELGRRDPSLAFRAASHLWASDLAAMSNAGPIDKGWMSLAVIVNDEALFVPEASRILLWRDGSVEIAEWNAKGFLHEPERTLGLRGALLHRILLSDQSPGSTQHSALSTQNLLRAWHILSAADLISIAFGMADQLTRRAIAHATNRVQFPGLFHDEDARDTIGKFGAIKQMVAEMGARRYLLETLDHELSPADFSDVTARRSALLKAVAAEALGTAPGSLSYNAGQIFGGTGYSEDDILSKFYRDAAAWRYLGQSNPHIWHEHGSYLLADSPTAAARLSMLEGEDVLFDQVAQRKALQTELDQLRILRTNLRTMFHQAAGDDGRSAALIASHDAHLLAAKALLFRTHARLEEGLPSEQELSLLRVWIENVVSGGVVSGEWSNSATHRPPLTTEDSPFTTYQQFLDTPSPYESGDFLCKPTNPEQPRYLPELVESDPFLAEADRYYRQVLTDYFGKQSKDGQPYERLIEAWHRPSEADLEFTRKHGFFRMLIPKELGGEGKKKCEYYLLTSHGQVLADVSWSLAIQANSSIGTTPILVARDKDLPKARKGAGPSQEEIGLRQKACDLALRWIASGQISAFALTEPSAGSDTARVATRAKLRSVPAEKQADGTYRYVPHGASQPRSLLDADRLEFCDNGAYYRYSPHAEPAPIRFDEYDYETDDPAKLRYFVKGGQHVYFTDIAYLRQRDGQLCYDYWELTGAKMWITNGRICGMMSLYAKTEEGVTGFIVDRHAEGLVVGKDEAKMGQNGSPTNEVSLQAVRVPRENVLGLEGRGQVNALETLNVGRAGLAMSAVAQIKSIIAISRDFQRGRESFSGRPSQEPVAPQEAGAAPKKTPDPLTLLDRMEEECFAAEAVAYEVIGRFEHQDTKSVRMESAIAKMLASELLHSVIEMAEDIHGLEGQTRRHLIEKRKRDARILNIYEGTNEVQRFLILKELVADVLPRWQERTTEEGGRMKDENERSASGSFFVDLVDDFRQRLTSAVQQFGPQLWQNPNLQADGFLLAEAAAWLKATDSVAARLVWRERRGEETSIAQRALARCAGEVRARLQRFDAAFARLKQGRYPESVRAAELLFHKDEGGRRKDENGPADVSSFILHPSSCIDKPLSVLVIVEPTAGIVPRPYVRDGQLLEPFVTLADSDRAALETALRLVDANDRNPVSARKRVSITVAAVGPARFVPVLREVQALGISPVLLLAPPDNAGETGPLAADQAAEALAEVLRQHGEKFDLILGPNRGADLEEGLIAPLTAQALGVPFAGSCANLAVRWTADEKAIRLLAVDGKQPRTRALPAAITVDAGTPLRAFTTACYFRAMAEPVVIEPWPSEVEPEPFKWRATTHVVTPAEDLPRPLHSDEAARLLREQLGVEADSGTPKEAATFDIATVEFPDVLEGGVILAVIAADRHGRISTSGLGLVAATQPMSAAADRAAAVLVLAPPDNMAQGRAVSQLASNGARRVAILAHEHATAPAEVRARLLAESWPDLKRSPIMVLGESWAESAFVTLRTRANRPTTLMVRVKKLDASSGVPVVETARANGRLRTERLLMALDDAKSYWVTATDDAEIVSGRLSVVIGQSGKTADGLPTDHGPLTTDRKVQRWTPPLETLFGSRDMQRLLAELKEKTGVVRLSDADFIIDVGYGVGNRDGYEEVILPLESALHSIGVRNIVVGGSRKVTEELHVLPVDRQIGQSGVSVNPRILLAVGISGAPQHLNYIGPRATVLAFNRDSEAPLMTLNRRQPRPKVYPIVGDLFQTVPAFIEALSQEAPR